MYASRKRSGVRKGWKGWVVTQSPPRPEKHINLDLVTVFQGRKTRSGKNFDTQPSKKLINLDVATVFQERKTRSGKNFGAMQVGKDG